MSRKKVESLKEALIRLNYNDKNGKGSMIGLVEPPPIIISPVDLALRSLFEILRPSGK